MMKQWICLLMFLLMLIGCNTAQPSPIIIDLIANDFFYTPARLEVKVGQQVQINFANEGLVLHDFSIAQLPVQEGSVKISGDIVTTGAHAHHDGAVHNEVHIALDPQHKGTIEFIPTQAGRYDIFCSVEGHKLLGMSGEMIVTD